MRTALGENDGYKKKKENHIYSDKRCTYASFWANVHRLSIEDI